MLTIKKRNYIGRAEMNATNYYVTACRLVIQANPDSLGSWQVGFFLRSVYYRGV